MSDGTPPDRYLGRVARRRDGVEYRGTRLIVWHYEVVDYWLTSTGTIAVPAGSIERPDLPPRVPVTWEST